jgi:AAA+ superfamily predicted ATPase
MSNVAIADWEESNQRSLMNAIEELGARLVTHHPALESDIAFEPNLLGQGEPSDTALDSICARFGLTAFERNILVLCAGAELSAKFASVCRIASREYHHPMPTFSLALAVLDEAHWSALLPSRPLRRWRLIEVGSGDSLTTSPLRIDERILHYLTGASCLDERLRGLVENVPVGGDLPPSQRAVANLIANKWPLAEGALTQLCGPDPAAKRSVAATACDLLGMNLSSIPATLTPRTTSELDLFIQLWEREAALHGCVLLVENEQPEQLDPLAEAALERLLETLRSPLMVSSREHGKPGRRLVLRYEVPLATSDEQAALWRDALGGESTFLNGKVQGLVSQFNLSSKNIVVAALGAEGTGDTLAASLWDACRVQSRPRMDGLAERIEPVATWDDLVLPEKQRQVLRQIAVHVRHRVKVFDEWGFGSKSSRGKGLSLVFAGPSGTGKTMASEVLANELRLDLYRIDLSRVVSKYIGETEKNLSRVFDAAEEGGAILLFDEADALFGKRSDVKDSHDRYANIEVSYLLQRMEAYRGLAVLTTNRKEALDTAFLRRIRFSVEFPFPDAAHREEIWRRVFPKQTPTQDLRPDRLARLNAAGGNIHNIALGAAFLAADASEPVGMSHLLTAARHEFAKLERPLADSEVAGWI